MRRSLVALSHTDSRKVHAEPIWQLATLRRVPRKRLAALVAALASAGCALPGTLELDVVNENEAEVVIDVFGPDGEVLGAGVVIPPGEGEEFAVERPASGVWAVTVNDRVVTHWEDWPQDRPITEAFGEEYGIIDIIVVIHADGSVSVHDAS
jgi:hypothetical protein